MTEIHSPRASVSADLQPGGTRSTDPGQPPLDLNHLRRFTHGDVSLEREILTLFSDQLPVTIGALKDAVSVKDWHIAAHTLKGSARAVGAWSLADAAELAENLTQFSDVLERAAFVSKIEQVARETRKYIGTVSGAV